ncbi:interleukin-1 receptor accessory protein-like 1 [Amphiura filiformis]|uniref:interleukin-1 receptor accessory protein-like 1 n=1 Tax=Amphiura filiformis TaxID=82378 RepID=UPI003B21930D
MALSAWNIVTLFAVCGAGAVFGADTTCNIFNPTPDGKLDYVSSTEWNNLELVVENHVRSLFCKVKNFCDLRWYDGTTKEPIEHEDGFIEFEENNQTLVILQARLSDERNYTCKASKGEVKLQPRTTALYVLPEETASVTVGIPQNGSCNSTTSDEGDTVTFFCFYTITIDNILFMDPSWTKLNGTGNSTDLLYVGYLNDVNKNKPGVTTWYQEIVHYDPEKTRVYPGENDQFFVYNSTLIIHNISEDAYGLYQFKVMLDDGNEDYHNLTLSPIPPRKIITTEGVIGVVSAIGSFMLLFTVFVLVYHKKKTQMKLYCKDNCIWRKPVEDNMDSDVYISYSHITSQESSEDLNFVVEILKVELENRGYTVIIRDVDHLPGTSIHEEILNSLDKSRRCILVISPAYINSWIGNYDINVLMDSVQNCKRQIIPIIYRDISHLPESDSHRLLKHIMHIVKTLRWPDEKNDGKLVKKRATFFQELMLRMPHFV